MNSIICGDIQEMPVRKLIVKAFVREVILDNDNVTITYNFTEHSTKYRVTQEIVQKIQRQSRKKTAYNKTVCSYKLPSLPPKSPVNKRVCRTFLFCSFAQNRLKTMERTARFLERTRRFRAFLRIRTVKISSFRHHLKFRSTYCRNSPIREAPFR